MKIFTFTVVFLLSVSLGFSQNKDFKTLRKQLRKVKTLKDADSFIQENAAYFGEVITLHARHDTSALANFLLNSKKGSFWVDDTSDVHVNYMFKVLSTDVQPAFRVSYIFIDGKDYSTSEIDSIRKIILDRNKEGEPFEQLASLFSMDRNAQKGGDLGWFDEKQMVNAFSEAVKSHERGAVFTVDVPEREWFYVIKNTHDPVMYQTARVLILKEAK
ncbi:peptidylprolyl isomerase [Cytophagaceae bacterium ABcell3]|nr:peptidylprolyl isomerase [Cytophagaceae bacterium ABcell3]